MSQWTLSSTYCSHLPLHLWKQAPWHAISLYTTLHCSTTSHSWHYKAPKKVHTFPCSIRELQCGAELWMQHRSSTDVYPHIREHMLKCFDQSPRRAETGLSSSPCGGWQHSIQEGSIHCQLLSLDSGCYSCCLRMYRAHRDVLLRTNTFHIYLCRSDYNTCFLWSFSWCRTDCLMRFG